MSFPNPECSACGYDPKGEYHYHCGKCGGGPTSMMGHYLFGEVICDPDRRRDMVAKNMPRLLRG